MSIGGRADLGAARTSAMRITSGPCGTCVSRIGRTIEVRWRDQETGAVRVGSRDGADIRPSWTYFWSCIWFLQELLIFLIGARVFWKRPNDDSARLFFVLCIVTVGAFMGGYHWTEIVFRAGADLPASRCSRSSCRW